MFRLSMAGSADVTLSVIVISSIFNRLVFGSSFNTISISTSSVFVFDSTSSTRGFFLHGSSTTDLIEFSYNSSSKLFSDSRIIA
jgi:hypothetical protein